MSVKSELFKGELMEELVRHYFLNAGYYVARGVKFRYEENDVTDVDIYLYIRTSSFSRQRINVDLKNRKTPQTFERILWANGLKALLKFDSCIVATTDQRPLIQTFGKLHNTTVLDGFFLKKLGKDLPANRITEDALIQLLTEHKSVKQYQNKNWRTLYDDSKSRLLSEQDFSGFNESLSVLTFFITQSLVDRERAEIAIRMVYVIMSHLLIIIDYVVKDVTFLEQSERERKLKDGFTYGNLGKQGVERIFSIVEKIAGSAKVHEYRRAMDESQNDILKDFFSRTDTTRNLFTWAKEFESAGFAQPVIHPSALAPQLKGVLALVLDYASIERKRYFDLPTVPIERDSSTAVSAKVNPEGNENS